MSTLDLRWARREGGGGRTERSYLDFVVDGVSLHLKFGKPDLITAIGWGPGDWECTHIDQLLLRAPTDAPSGRVPIYVCPECGDLGCGAITARISKTPDAFVWSDFALENDYAPNMTDTESFQAIGPFAFNKHEYWKRLDERRAELRC